MLRSLLQTDQGAVKVLYEGKGCCCCASAGEFQGLWSSALQAPSLRILEGCKRSHKHLGHVQHA